MASNLWRKVTDATGPDAGIHHDHQFIGTEFGDLRMFTDHRVEQLRKVFIGTVQTLCIRADLGEALVICENLSNLMAQSMTRFGRHVRSRVRGRPCRSSC